MRVAKAIELDETTLRELRGLARRRTVEARLQQRALVILLAAQGRQNKDIAIEAGLDRRQIAMWRERFLAGGIDALRKDAPRSGRPATITAEMESRIVQATLHDNPTSRRRSKDNVFRMFANCCRASRRRTGRTTPTMRAAVTRHWRWPPRWRCCRMSRPHCGVVARRCDTGGPSIASRSAGISRSGARAAPLGAPHQSAENQSANRIVAATAAMQTHASRRRLVLS